HDICPYLTRRSSDLSPSPTPASTAPPPEAIESSAGDRNEAAAPYGRVTASMTRNGPASRTITDFRLSAAGSDLSGGSGYTSGRRAAATRPTTPNAVALQAAAGSPNTSSTQSPSGRNSASEIPTASPMRDV